MTPCVREFSIFISFSSAFSGRLVIDFLYFSAITIMLSLLARLHNILDDNSNRELNGEYMAFWPTSVTK